MKVVTKKYIFFIETQQNQHIGPSDNQSTCFFEDEDKCRKDEWPFIGSRVKSFCIWKAFITMKWTDMKPLV